MEEDFKGHNQTKAGDDEREEVDSDEAEEKDKQDERFHEGGFVGAVSSYTQPTLDRVIVLSIRTSE